MAAVNEVRSCAHGRAADGWFRRWRSDGISGNNAASGYGSCEGNCGPVDSASITGIRGITQEPGSNQIKIQYDKVYSDQAQGSVDDPKIQQLLLFAARNNINSGVRLDSIDLLTKSPDDTRVREALIFALRYDRNPGVRLKALDGLRSYVKDDQKVRDAVLEA